MDDGVGPDRRGVDDGGVRAKDGPHPDGLRTGDVVPRTVAHEQRSRRIVDAEGLPSEPFGAAFAWTAYSPAAGFAGRLKDQGAMLVIPLLGGLRFASICGGGMELLSRADTTASDP